MKIVIASDHRGYQLKQQIIASYDTTMGDIEWINVGCDSIDSCDYPIYAHKAMQMMQSGFAEYAILLCNTGVGMSIVANRYSEIYGALCWNQETARLSKEHDNANVLIIPAGYVSLDEASIMITAWKTATFLGGRHADRLKQID